MRSFLKFAIIASLCLEIGALSAADNSFCLKVLKQFGVDDSQIIATPRIEIPKQMAVESEGKDSHQKFKPAWKVDAMSSELGISFAYKDHRGTEVHSANLWLAKQAGDPHAVEIRFKRNFEGSFEDLNLLTPVLEYLFLRAESTDRFILEINDPTDVDALNQIFEKILVQKKYFGAFPRRFSTENATDPAWDQIHFNVMSDSFFPVLSPGDAKVLFDSLSKPFYEAEGKMNTDLNYLEALTQEFQKLPLGQTIVKTRSWDMKMGLRHMALGELDTPPEASGLSPYLYQYVVELRPLY